MFLSPPLLPTPVTPNNPGTMGGLFLDGEESPALEDISKWTVEDVCSFVSNLAGCTEYTQVNPSGPRVPWQEHPAPLGAPFPPGWPWLCWKLHLRALQALPALGFIFLDSPASLAGML